jgi:hypothetical protein
VSITVVGSIAYDRVKTPFGERERMLGGALRQAMAYGTALASFNVEEFGAERVVRLAVSELHDRVADLRRFTQLEQAALELEA